MLEAIPPFANHLPVRVRFGDGAVDALPEVLAAERAERPLLLVDPLVAGIPDAGATTVRKRPGEPTFDDVDELAETLRVERADILVAVGGGTVLDTAKAARVALTQGGPYRRLVAGSVVVERPAIPLVTVPTTAGTGSEVSGGAVVTDPHTHRKTGLASPLMRAQHALVDPELTHGLPREPTMFTGVDALAQAIAAVVVEVRTPVADAIGLEAARLAAAALPLVLADGRDAPARGQMACASLMAGLAMNLSECGSEHSLAHALGARFGLPHGLTVGLVLAETMDHDRRTVPARFERVADALGAPPDGSRDGSRAVAAVERLLAGIGFPTLRATGVSDADLDALADEALAGWIPVAPARWARDDVLAAYRRALALERRRAPSP